MIFRKSKRATAESGVDWSMIVPVMLLGYELGEAEKMGVSEHAAKSDHAGHIWQTVADEVGFERIRRAFVDCDEAMQTDDKSAVAARARDQSGYTDARRRLFPDA